MSLNRLFAFAVVATLAVAAHTQAQEEKADDKTKEAVRQRLARAEDEYRNYFKRPEKTFEFWAAIKHEFAVGKYDLAALHLKQMLEKMPAEEVDDDLARIENAEGMSSFLKLTLVKEKDWSPFPPFRKEAMESVATLMKRVTAAVDKSLSEPARFEKFIPRLAAPTEEERLFAFAQIDRSKERAASYLIDALRASVGKPMQRVLADAMVRFDADMVPAWLEVLKAEGDADAKDADLRVTLLNIIDRRREERAAPYLWHLSTSKRYPPLVNDQARQVLARLAKSDPEKLPPAHIALVEMAERYYQHKMPFPAGKPIRVWPWNGAKLATKPVELTARQAEEFYGKRYAREALDLQPTYLPAQTAFLNLTLDRAYGAELDQVILRKMPPNLQQLVGSIDGDLLLRVLERALDDGAIPVIIAATQALGDRGEFSAARPAIGGAPRGITRALYYPDRRVQYAAIKALLKMPTLETPVASARVVDVLRRFVAASGTPKALVVFVPADQAAETRKGFKESGLEPVLVQNLKQAMERPFGLADVEVVFLHGSAERELPFAIAQLRGDADQGNVPIFILSPKENDTNLQKLAARHRHVTVIPEALLVMGEELKADIDNAIKQAAGAKLTAAERKEVTIGSLDILWRMARNEIPGYDVRPALAAVTTALRSPEGAPLAMEILSRLPGAEPQTRLAGIVLDAGADKLRFPAALELNRHVQKYGVLLQRKLINQLKKTHQDAADPLLKAELSITLGAMGPSAELTGSRLLQFRPDVPAPAEKKEPQKEDK